MGVSEDIGRVQCGGCRLLLDPAQFWTVVFSTDDPKVVAAVKAGRLNSASCPRPWCGHDGWFVGPAIYVDLKRRLGVAVVEDAPARHRSVPDARESLLQQARAATSEDLSWLDDRLLLATDPGGVPGLLEVPDERVEAASSALWSVFDRMELTSQERAARLLEVLATTGVTAIHPSERTAAIRDALLDLRHERTDIEEEAWVGLIDEVSSFIDDDGTSLVLSTPELTDLDRAVRSVAMDLLFAPLARHRLLSWANPTGEGIELRTGDIQLLLEHPQVVRKAVLQVAESVSEEGREEGLFTALTNLVDDLTDAVHEWLASHAAEPTAPPELGPEAATPAAAESDPVHLAAEALYAAAGAKDWRSVLIRSAELRAMLDPEVDLGPMCLAIHGRVLALANLDELDDRAAGEFNEGSRAFDAALDAGASQYFLQFTPHMNLAAGDWAQRYLRLDDALAALDMAWRLFARQHQWDNAGRAATRRLGLLSDLHAEELIIAESEAMLEELEEAPIAFRLSLKAFQTLARLRLMGSERVEIVMSNTKDVPVDPGMDASPLQVGDDGTFSSSEVGLGDQDVPQVFVVHMRRPEGIDRIHSFEGHPTMLELVELFVMASELDRLGQDLDTGISTQILQMLAVSLNSIGAPLSALTLVEHHQRLVPNPGGRSTFAIASLAADLEHSLGHRAEIDGFPELAKLHMRRTVEIVQQMTEVYPAEFETLVDVNPGVIDSRVIQALALEALGDLDQARLGLLRAAIALERRRQGTDARFSEERPQGLVPDRALQSSLATISMRAIRVTSRLLHETQVPGEDASKMRLEMFELADKMRSRRHLDALGLRHPADEHLGHLSIPLNPGAVADELDEGTVVVLYTLVQAMRGEDARWLGLVLRTGGSVDEEVVYPVADEVWAAVDDFHQALALRDEVAKVGDTDDIDGVRLLMRANRSFDDALEELGRLLVPDTLLTEIARGSIRRIVICAENYLLEVPFAAMLHAPAHGLSVTLASSPSSFARHRRLTRLRDLGAEPLAILVCTGSNATSQARDAAIAGRLEQLGEELGLEPSIRCVVSGADATVHRLRDEVGRGGVVMFLCHGHPDPDAPSTVQLRMWDGAISTDDLTEAVALGSRASALVALACSSGRLDFQTHWASRDVEGLGEAAIVAGAPLVVSCSWPLWSDVAEGFVGDVLRNLGDHGLIDSVSLAANAAASFRRRQAPWFWAPITLWWSGSDAHLEVGHG